MELDGSMSDASGDLLGTPTLGPFAHPLVAAYPLAAVMREIVADLDGELGQSAFVHAAQETLFVRPVPREATLTARASVARSGAYGFGRGYLIEFEVVGDHGLVLCCGTTIVVGPGSTSGPALAVDRRPVRSTRTIATTERRIERVDVTRYATVSGDDNPVHLSEEVARSVGLPTVAVHGMHLLALFATEVVRRRAGGDPTRVAAVRARFSHVVHPPADLLVEVRETADPGCFGGAMTCGGRRVLRDAAVELRPDGPGDGSAA
jgi:acyl dehydratase